MQLQDPSPQLVLKWTGLDSLNLLKVRSTLEADWEKWRNSEDLLCPWVIEQGNSFPRYKLELDFQLQIQMCLSTKRHLGKKAQPKGHSSTAHSCQVCMGCILLTQQSWQKHSEKWPEVLRKGQEKGWGKVCDSSGIWRSISPLWPASVRPRLGSTCSQLLLIQKLISCRHFTAVHNKDVA